MTLLFEYETIKNFYDFYKSCDWKTIQKNKSPPLRSDIIVMDFRDNVLVDGEIRPFYVLISQSMPRKFNISISIVSQNFNTHNKTLRESVKWINSIFNQETCKECKLFAKLDKDKKLCVDCYRKLCFKVNTDKECSICLDNIEHDVYRTKCNHYFHFKCIMGLDKCPLCRYNFNSEINWVPQDFQDDISSSSDEDYFNGDFDSTY